MLSLLATAGKSLLRQVLPSAINWGVNKLIRSNFGKTYIQPALMGAYSSFAPMKMETSPAP
jgi:hypothetical protein